MTTFTKTKFKISLWSSESFQVEYNIVFGIPIEFPSKRKKIIQIGPETTKLRKLDLCGHNAIKGYSFLSKYNIGFGVPIEFLSQRKKLFKSVKKQRNYALIKIC